jgi:hypothetical protein
MSAGLAARFVRFAPPLRELEAARAGDFRTLDFEGDFRTVDFRAVDFDADFRAVDFAADFGTVDFAADFRTVDFDADLRTVDFAADFRPAALAAPERFAALFLAGFLVAMRSPRMERSWFQSETVVSSPRQSKALERFASADLASRRAAGGAEGERGSQSASFRHIPTP